MSTNSKGKTRGPYGPSKEENFWGVFYLNKHGVTCSDIARAVELPKSTVQTIISRIWETGSPLPKKSPGSPKKINERAQRQIERTVKKNPSISYGKLKLEMKEAGLDVCKSTISSSLKRKKIWIRCCGI